MRDASRSQTETDFGPYPPPRGAVFFPGNKKDNVTIIYTPWANLRKNASMATGQVGFVDPKKVNDGTVLPLSPFSSPPSFLPHPLPPSFLTQNGPVPPHHILTQPFSLLLSQQTKKHLVPTRHNATINRLTKTRRTLPADELPADKEAYLARRRAQKRVESERRAKEEEKVAKERREEKEMREKGYGELMAGGGGRSNEEGFDEDDFM